MVKLLKGIVKRPSFQKRITTIIKMTETEMSNKSKVKHKNILSSNREVGREKKSGVTSIFIYFIYFVIMLYGND